MEEAGAGLVWEDGLAGCCTDVMRIDEWRAITNAVSAGPPDSVREETSQTRHSARSSLPLAPSMSDP